MEGTIKNGMKDGNGRNDAKWKERCKIERKMQDGALRK